MGYCSELVCVNPADYSVCSLIGMCNFVEEEHLIKVKYLILVSVVAEVILIYPCSLDNCVCVCVLR